MKYIKNEKILELVKNKESHPGKKLTEHIEEIKEFGIKLKNYFNFDWSLFEFFAEFHDLGKLNPKWEVGKRIISHSAYSLYYTYRYFREDLKKYFGEIYPILLYLIYRHHSLLDKRSCSYGYFQDIIKIFDLEKTLPKDFFEKITKTIERLDFESKIKIIDTFGIFKLCDILSAKKGEIENIDYFVSLLDAKINPEKFIYEYIKEKGRNIDENKLRIQKEVARYDEAILMAPTGWGKTVSSILFFKKKLLLTLPTITAIRSFYEKLKDVFKNKTEVYFYLYDAFLSYESEKLDNERLFSYELSKILFYPIMITTIDQILFTFLQSGKYYIRRYNLQNTSFVLDEIHLLSPQMLYLFLHFYKKFKKIYNFRFLMMSATLPKAIIEFIKKDMKINAKIFNFVDEYRKKRRVIFKYFDFDILDWIKENIEFFEKDKKFLIIVNTVGKAQEVYFTLKKNYNNVLLLHSRFLADDRFNKEGRIEKYKILITTQVAEVSLDIDRDFLLTELAPIPSLIQRFGRVNRYNDKTEEINTYIFKPKELEDLKKKERKIYVYDKHELELSEKIIKELEEKLKNEYLLIEKLNDYFTYENLKKILKETIFHTYTVEDLIKYWEKEFNYFFTAIANVDKNKELVNSLFNLRGSTNVLVLLDPRMIENDELRNNLISLLEKWEKKLDFKERKELFMRIKGYLIPIPTWILKKKGELRERVGFPVIYSTQWRYSSEYGLYNIEKVFDDFIY